ncbi:MAG: LAGLIDADG family homing endonuclease [Patescibacteria group bacterium]
MSKAYLLGLLHDATERPYTFRVGQKNPEFVELIAHKVRKLGANAWTYREGQKRNLFVVEFRKSLLRDAKVESRKDKADYIRGYFDAEGGIAKSPKVRFYLYFAQKNLKDLTQVRAYLKESGIQCGKIHNPSRRADPNYFRFFVSAKSYKDFAEKIGSWHPEKKVLLKVVR